VSRRVRNKGRPRNRSWEDGWLTVYWGTDEDGEGPDVVYGSPCRPDGHLMHAVLSCERYSYDGTREPSLRDELVARGYLIETLRFEIKRNRKPNEAIPGGQPDGTPLREPGGDGDRSAVTEPGATLARAERERDDARAEIEHAARVAAEAERDALRGALQGAVEERARYRANILVAIAQADRARIADQRDTVLAGRDVLQRVVGMLVREELFLDKGQSRRPRVWRVWKHGVYDAEGATPAAALRAADLTVEADAIEQDPKEES
jgi:hypothetical protein